MFFSFGLTTLFYHGSEAVKSKRRHGVLWYRENSAYLICKEKQHLRNYESQSHQGNENDEFYSANNSKGSRLNWFNIVGIFVRAFF